MNHRTVLLLDVCVKCDSVSSELWGWRPGEAISDTAACQLPEEGGASATANSQSRVTPSPQELVLVWRAGSKPPVGGVVSSLGR